jgi:hypothetical protein
MKLTLKSASLPLLLGPKIRLSQIRLAGAATGVIHLCEFTQAWEGRNEKQ